MYFGTSSSMFGIRNGKSLHVTSSALTFKEIMLLLVFFKKIEWYGPGVKVFCVSQNMDAYCMHQLAYNQTLHIIKYFKEGNGVWVRTWGSE